MIKRCLLLSTLVFTALHTVQAQYKAEYFYDADPGYGNAVQTTVNIGTNELLLSTANLQEGFHLLGIRSVDAEGRWSPTISHPVLVTNDLVYAGAEYYVDTNPGKGKGISIPVTDRKHLVFSVKTNELAIGTHNLSVRIQHIDGTWSDVATRPFAVVEKQKETGFVLEYFYNVDPGYGMAKQVSVNEGDNIVYLPTGELDEGMHLMSMRSKDKNGEWSSVISSPVYVIEPIKINDAEWFVDTDPGEGKANQLAVGKDEVSFSVPTDNLSIGSHTLTLRAKISNTGNWVIISETPFTVTVKSGIASVSIDMDVKMSYANGLLHLYSSLAMDSFVDVYSIDGKKIAEKHWDCTQNEQTLLIPGNVSTLIVKVTQKDGKRFTRKINQN